MENTNDLMTCLFIGKCKVYDSEHYFYLNGERVKADRCTSSIYGSSSCTYQSITYTSVPYEIIDKGYHYEYSNIYITIWTVIILFILFKIFNAIFGR